MGHGKADGGTDKTQGFNGDFNEYGDTNINAVTNIVTNIMTRFMPTPATILAFS